MKRIAFITSNKILAQSLEVIVKAKESIGFEFFLLFDLNQVLLDVEVLEIEVALIDMALFDARGLSKEGGQSLFTLSENIHKKLPNCPLLLLVSQEDQENRAIAAEAKRKEIVDDFIFYDSSLKYLLAKLTSL